MKSGVGQRKEQHEKIVLRNGSYRVNWPLSSRYCLMFEPKITLSIDYIPWKTQVQKTKLSFETFFTFVTPVTKYI